jgi:hypothetical protein
MANPKPLATPKAYRANMPSIGDCSGSDKPSRARVSVGILFISAGIGSAGIDGSVVIFCSWLELRVAVAPLFFHKVIYDAITSDEQNG